MFEETCHHLLSNWYAEVLQLKNLTEKNVLIAFFVNFIVQYRDDYSFKGENRNENFLLAYYHFVSFINLSLQIFFWGNLDIGLPIL